MRYLLPLLLLVGCSSPPELTNDEKARMTAFVAVAIASETPQPEDGGFHPTPPKVPRSRCTECRGTGRVLSGDGLSWVPCDACEPPNSAPNALPNALPQPLFQLPSTIPQLVRPEPTPAPMEETDGTEETPNPLPNPVPTSTPNALPNSTPNSEFPPPKLPPDATDRLRASIEGWRQLSGSRVWSVSPDTRENLIRHLKQVHNAPDEIDLYRYTPDDLRWLHDGLHCGHIKWKTDPQGIGSAAEDSRPVAIMYSPEEFRCPACESLLTDPNGPFQFKVVKLKAGEFPPVPSQVPRDRFPLIKIRMPSGGYKYVWNTSRESLRDWYHSVYEADRLK
jgi:hypothetical protein